MYIELYFNDKDETHIVGLEESSDPFNLSDEMYLSIDELFPVKLNQFKEETQINLLKKDKEFRSKFHNKKIKLIKRSKHLRFDVLGKAIVTIEYICTLV